MGHAKHIAICFAMVQAMAVLSGCGAPQPRDFGGRWHPVNRFDAAPQSIPLQQPYEYFASPLDGTLKTMLSRWAKDTGMVLVYQWPEDYTLFTPVSGIHTQSLDAATSQLSGVYAAQGVSIATAAREIRVSPAPASTGEEAAKRTDAARITSAPAASPSG